MDISENPYASPPADVELIAAEGIEGESERIRQQYLRHEASVRSIGSLYYLGCGLTGTGGLFLFGNAVLNGDVETLAMGIAYVGLAVLFFFVARGLRKLSSWVRWPVGILAGIGLMGVPFGTLINGLILYLVFCRKGRMVFSPEYHEVMRQTPHIKCRPSLLSLLVMILVGILVAIVLSLLILFLIDLVPSLILG